MPRRRKLTVGVLQRARERFHAWEPRDLFYRAATQLIDSAEKGGDLDLAESIAVLLQTWNSQFYRFRRGFKEQDFVAIRGCLRRHGPALSGFRRRRLTTLRSDDEHPIIGVFQDFEVALGPVGSAKCLHLLAPNFFPIWDGTIAREAYGVHFNRSGQNGGKYLEVMRLTLAEIEQAGGWSAIQRGVRGNPLKAVDEYNFCVYTKKWSLR